MIARSPFIAAHIFLLSLISGAAHASLAEVQIDKVYEYQQTSAGVALNGVVFAAAAYKDVWTFGSLTSGTLIYPGAISPQSLTSVVGNFTNSQAQHLGFNSTLMAPSALSAAYGFGTYSFTVQEQDWFPSSQSIQSASLNYSQDAYTADVPALSSSSYAALQGINASQSLTLQFNSFTPSAAATNSSLSLKIIDLTANTSFLLVNGAPSTTTSAFLAGGTLTAGHSYEYALNFGDDIMGTDPTSSVRTDQYFSVRTFGNFTAAVPEPETSGMMLVGVVLVGFVTGRRSV